MQKRFIDSLDGIIQRIVTRFQPERVILFGSHAVGGATDDSDLDLLIVMPVETTRRSKANEIDLALADRLVPLDIVVVTPEQFEQQKDLLGTLVHEAVEQGRVVYDRAA